MRLRNNPDAINELQKTKYLVQKFPLQIDRNTIIEVGMGKGEMITRLAKKYPNNKYIGIEKFATVAHKAMKKAEKLNLNNFQIIVEDLVNAQNMLKGKVNTIWLTFSDPWPKARHEKRRLTHKNFLEIYKRLLSKDGTIRFKTDNDKLFNWSIDHMKENGLKLSNVTSDFHSHKSSEDNIMTEYEIKWSSSGKKINYLEARF